MGSRCVLGHGKCPAALARDPVGSCPERIPDRLSSGGSRGSLCAPGVGMARHVLDRGYSCLIGFLHPIPSERVRSLETTPRPHSGCNFAQRERSLEDLSVPGAPHDVDDVPLAWNAGPVPSFSPGSTRPSAENYFLRRDSLQHWSGFGIVLLRSSVGNIWSTPRHAACLGADPCSNSALGIRRIPADSCSRRIPRANGCARSMGNHSSSPQRTITRPDSRFNARFCLSTGNSFCRADKHHRVCLAGLARLLVGTGGI